MNYYFGLYFGNTNMCIAVCRNGKTEVIANSAGDRLTPSFAACSNGEICVGIAAKQFMLRNADDIMTNVKDLLWDSQENFDSKILKPHEVLVLLFKSMVSIAKSHCHETDVPVVITVPMNFSSEIKEIVENAAIEADFRILRLISEPSAAMLAYDLGQDNPNSDYNCLIYRLGGTSSDIMIFQVRDGMYRALATSNKKGFGGNVLTKKLADFIAGEFKKLYRVDIRENKRSTLKLYAAAEVCKHALSIMTSSQCFAESVYDGIDLNVNVSRARFEALILTELNQCFVTILETLHEASLNVTDISKIVLCGGSCKIPKLQQFLTDKFPQCDILTSIPSDEIMAVGAAKQAALITHKSPLTDQDYFINVLTNTVCLKKMKDGFTDVITMFNKGSKVPVSFQVILTVDNNSPLEICEKLNEMDDFKVLGKCSVLSAKEITIRAEITSNYKLWFTYTDNSTGLSKQIII